MKRFYKNGLLFGSINIADFLIILTVVLLVPYFLVTYSILQKSPKKLYSTWVTVEAVTFIMPEMTGLLKEGDDIYDYFGNRDGKVIKIISKSDEEAERIKGSILYKYNWTGEKYVANPHYEYRVPLFLELRLLCAKSLKEEPWYFRRKALVVSLEKSFDLETDKGIMLCHVLKIKEWGHENEDIGL